MKSLFEVPDSVFDLRLLIFRSDREIEVPEGRFEVDFDSSWELELEGLDGLGWGWEEFPCEITSSFSSRKF